MIPNIFHFVFGLREQKEPFHLMYYLCLASCININEPDEVHFHYYYEPWGEWWERIKPRLVLRRIEPNKIITDYQYSDLELNKYRYAHLADFERLRILEEEGGIYADIDTLFLRPLPKSWFKQDFILGVERPPLGAEGSLCNAWIASAPGAKFCRLWLEGMFQAFDGTWSNHSTILPYKLWKQHPELVDVKPDTAFYALDHSPQEIDALFLQQVELPKQAYSLHLWNHLWFDRHRLDFSFFHEGRLTVDYVRYAKTTYSVHARAHLPSNVQGSIIAYYIQATQAVIRDLLIKARLQLGRMKRKLCR